MTEKSKKEPGIGEIIGKIAVNRIKSEIPGIESTNQTIDDLKSEIKEVRDSIEKERFSSILIIGIFASIITFLSVQVQILSSVTNIYHISFLSLLTFTGLALFLHFIFVLVHFPKKQTAFWFLISGVLIVLLGGAVILAFHIPEDKLQNTQDISPKSEFDDKWKK